MIQPSLPSFARRDDEESTRRFSQQESRTPEVGGSTACSSKRHSPLLPAATAEHGSCCPESLAHKAREGA